MVKPSKFAELPHMGAAMARPFIAGARIQLERYLEAQRILTTYHIGSAGVDRCMYELSSLLEHLATVARYLELCGVAAPLNPTIFDMRNHLRHDVREEFDKDERKKKERAARLGLHPNLQGHITFTNGGVTVGTTELTAEQISSFLDTAEMIVYALMMGVRVDVTDTGLVMGGLTVQYKSDE